MYRAQLGLAILVLLSGCNNGPKSSRGFSLPDGDQAKGKEVYVRLQCNACHKIADVEQLAASDAKPELSIALGGEVPRIKTYGELVTSIINPSHRLASSYQPPAGRTESPMKNYNDTMTVSELIDLVAFLQSHYKLIEYDPTPYPPYAY